MNKPKETKRNINKANINNKVMKNVAITRENIAEKSNELSKRFTERIDRNYSEERRSNSDVSSVSNYDDDYECYTSYSSTDFMDIDSDDDEEEDSDLSSGSYSYTTIDAINEIMEANLYQDNTVGVYNNNENCPEYWDDYMSDEFDDMLDEYDDDDDIGDIEYDDDDDDEVNDALLLSSEYDEIPTHDTDPIIANIRMEYGLDDDDITDTLDIQKIKDIYINHMAPNSSSGSTASS